MVLEDKIKIVPMEQPFLRVLAELVYVKFKDSLPDLSSILVVFPTQRNKFYFRRYLLEASRSRGIIPPIMKTVDELLGLVYEQVGGKRSVLLNNIERNFVLKQIVDSLKVGLWQDIPFLKFISIGDRLLGFFDELAKERVELAEIEKVIELGHYPYKYIEKELPIIRQIYDRYRQSIGSSAYHDEMDKCDLITERLSAQTLCNYQHIIIAGLAAPTQIESIVIKELLNSHDAELIIHSGKPDEIRQDSETDSPFYVHNKFLNFLEIDFSRLPNPTQKPFSKPVIHVKCAATEFEQFCHLRETLKKAARVYKDLHRIAVVLPDEGITYSITEALNASGLEYNLSAGLPLTHTVFYSFLEQLNQVIKSGFHYKEFFSFIRHPLFKNAVVDEISIRPLIYRLEDFMIRNRLNYFDLKEIGKTQEFQPLLDLISECLAISEADSALDEFINNLIRMLNRMLAINHDLIKTNSPGITQFFDQLHNLSALRVSDGYMKSDHETLDFILRMLKNEKFTTPGDPLRGIQVIGLLEARNLDFDCLILPSMNEGIFPRRSDKDIFINQEVRRASHLPYDKERENLYYYYFTELINNKSEVYISYVAEEKKDLASRFVGFLTDQGIKVDTTPIRLKESYLTGVKRKVNKSNDLVKYLNKWVADPGLTQRALNDYKKCPYGFYLGQILGVEEPEEIIEEPEAAQWGSIIHLTIKNFYKYDYPRGLTLNELNRAQAALEKQFEKVIAKNRFMALKPKAVINIDAQIFKRRLRPFLELEVERFKEGFKIFKGVLERGAKHHIMIDNKPVRLYGYIDRIDILSDKYYIIDYKTGNIPKEADYRIGGGFSDFQLPLYSLIFSKEHFDMIGGMIFYEIKQKTTAKNIVEGVDVQDYLQKFRNDVLVPTIREILDPLVAFYQTDDKEACRNCSYQQLCGTTDGAED